MTNYNPTPEEKHIQNLVNKGARIRRPDRTAEPVTMDFYRKAVEDCVKGGYDAITYDLEFPGIDAEFMIAFWPNGHVESGRAQRIFQCLAY